MTLDQGTAAHVRAVTGAARLAAADRRVIERVISEDEDAQPRDLRIDDAALREAMGLF